MSDLAGYCYLTIGIDGRRSRPKGIVVRNMTKGKPNLEPGEFAIKVVLSVPASVFDQFTPTVEISMPEDSIHIEPHVEATGVPVVTDPTERNDA